ncbi:hypothetical protein LHYA1_G009242, partial [Lachnellula hyalina]
PHLAKQVVLVIRTSSSKSLIFIVDVLVTNARTIILVLPIVILQGDMLRRYHLIVNTKQLALLIIILVEATYIKTFLNYAYSLVSRQRLD